MQEELPASNEDDACAAIDIQVLKRRMSSLAPEAVGKSKRLLRFHWDLMSTRSKPLIETIRPERRSELV